MRLAISQQPSVAVILLTSIFLFSTGYLRAQSATIDFESGVVVLVNGQTMEGEISRQDNKVVVQLESGSRILLAEERVLFTAANLSDAYWELAARTGATDLEGQVSVFQWCLRNELFEEGANHLLVLQESKIPARRLAALDFDLTAKKKRADFRNAQAIERTKQKQQVVKIEMQERARKERIETLIGGKTVVTIPDLHRVPRRPIRNLKHATPEPVAVARPAVADGAELVTEMIDQFGNKVTQHQASQKTVRQVSYQQPIFSSPAIAASASPPVVAGAKNARKIPKPNDRSSSVESGFSVSKTEANGVISTLPGQSAEPKMVDPFDADYFNRRFAAPAIEGK